MTARCIKITADNSQLSSNDQEFLQCHQDLPNALSLSVLSNIALFSLTISLILFPRRLSLFGCFVHYLTLWSLRSQRRGQEVGEMFWVAGWRRLRHQTGSLHLLCFQASVILIKSTMLPLYLFASFHSLPILDHQIGRYPNYHVAVTATLHSQFRKGSWVLSSSAPGVSKARIVSPQDSFHRRCNAPGKGAYAHRHSNNFLSKTGRPLPPVHSIPCCNHLLILIIIVIIVTIIIHKTSLS